MAIEERAAGERLKAAQEELRRACVLLCNPSPDAMAACSRALQNAASELQAWLPEGKRSRGDRTASDALLGLRQSVVNAQRLLQSAAEYHANWLQRMCLMASGYTGDGHPATVDPASRVCLRA
jgi:hypothetical protein